MRPGTAAALLLVLACTGAPSSSSESLEGMCARYAVDPSQAPIPGLTEVVVGFPRAETIDGDQAIWFQLQAMAGRG